MTLTDATRDEAVEVYARLAETEGPLDGLSRATFKRKAVAVLKAVREDRAR